MSAVGNSGFPQGLAAPLTSTTTPGSPAKPGFQQITQPSSVTGLQGISSQLQCKLGKSVQLKNQRYFVTFMLQLIYLVINVLKCCTFNCFLCLYCSFICWYAKVFWSSLKKNFFSSVNSKSISTSKKSRNQHISWTSHAETLPSPGGTPSGSAYSSNLRPTTGIDSSGGG